MDMDFILALAKAATSQPEPEPEPEAAALRFTLPERAAGTALVVTCHLDKAVGIGGVAWQACLPLSHAMAVDSQLFSGWGGARVLELGCGTGLCGLSAWLLGARDVVLTDAADCGPLIQRSIRDTRAAAAADGRAEASGTIAYAPLRWGEQPLPEAATGVFDIVLGSDLTYNTDDHALLLATLLTVCSAAEAGGGATTVVLAHQHRPLSATVPEDPLPSFIASASALGFSVTEPQELPAAPPELYDGGHDVPSIDQPVSAIVLTLEG